MNRQTFALPDLGEGLADAELVRWLVRVGDEVAVDTPVAEVETAKAMVEVPSPFAGLICELHGAEGSIIKVGEPLISVEDRETDDPPVPALSGAGSGNVLIGYGTAADPAAVRRRRRRQMSGGARPFTHPVEDAKPAVASPIVRKLANDHHVDLAALSGSGPNGLITRADVDRASVPPTAGEPDQRDRRTALSIREIIPLTGIRKAIATALSRSRNEIPEAATWVDVDATALLELRAALSTEERRAPNLLALLARFVVAGLREFPALNSRVDVDRQEIVHLDGVNLGIATQTDRGLLVPTVRDAHRCSARELDAQISRVVHAARDGSLPPAEMNCGSFTLNNYGAFGVDGSVAIINHPEVAILGIGRVLDRPWVVNGQIVVRTIVQLSLVFDHRVCDGGTAGGFLRFVADAIESPVGALADL